MLRHLKITMLIIPLLILAAVFWFGRREAREQLSQVPVISNSITAQLLSPASSTASVSSTPPTSAPSQTAELSLPLPRAAERVTKKQFGLYVTKQNSPVQPERFSGYHTGTDFEVFDNEKNSDVPVSAICAGKLLQKGYASGYGGYAVQSCIKDGQTITVIYGHLREYSIDDKIGQELKIGNKIGVLGTGYSEETDGERKHLHLGIHKGPSINIKGYVQSASELEGWIDAGKLLEFQILN